jgi:hypothetical protein
MEKRAPPVGPPTRAVVSPTHQAYALTPAGVITPQGEPAVAGRVLGALEKEMASLGGAQHDEAADTG